MQRTVDYIDGKVLMIDQTRIPAELVTIELSTPDAVADAIVEDEGPRGAGYRGRGGAWDGAGG